ncbi:glycoside hydrolase [Mycobacterium sp. 852013-50091_SCH5140682]|uniref:C40 family peptidase n=1 Tax=Mycobacterium sp. 852013-50091_SCH5140682 TaxID=1834109 RepID=UPI0007EA6A49|nr:C40 family peptidase [Mycobacterium sp. 852013-50091_SCH5140682]OBC07451.1 glycoside hydrolase [Mycobacterium sp. 852013-50091_SCH5140682]
MPGPLVSALVAPLREVQALVGPGWAAPGSPDAVLAEVRDALSTVATASRGSWAAVGDWSGAAADAAGRAATATAATADALADRAETLGAAARHAGAAARSAAARLQAIVSGFEERAAALEPRLDEPGVAEALLGEAQQALRDAISVVDELRTQLDDHASAVSAEGVAAPAATVPAGLGTPSGLGAAPGLGASPAMSTPPGPGALSGLTGPLAALVGRHRGGGSAGSAPESAIGTRDPGMFGDGVAVRLPDGSTARAPNAVAAEAVRNALTQLGVPYRWGGTTPGVGLDCSGLTQWAYHEAGLDIPRLAQEQDVGAAVSADTLRPGDLAVWDGHVAMIVGDSTMIEAGDPVQLSPIRTTNAGQGFHGFFRPTA